MLASASTYRVRPGDTLSKIAATLGTTERELVARNGLKDRNSLKVGQVLVAPEPAKQASRARPLVVGSQSVSPGDNDTKIAKQAGISVAELHALNPDVNWRALQVGQSLRLKPPAWTPKVTVAKSRPATVVAKPPASSATSAVVQKGDGAARIAKRYGLTTAQLKQLNPAVDWTRIQPGDRLTLGLAASTPKHVAAKSAKPSAPVASTTGPPKRIQTGYGKVTATSARLRKSPSEQSGMVGLLQNGQVVAILGTSETGWYRVSGTGGGGWVRSDLLGEARPPKSTARVRESVPITESTRSITAEVATAPSANVESLLSKARSMRGVRYRYGAMSRSSTDCSGYTWQVFQSQGIRLPRTSGEQAKIGQKVNGELLPGDLVFFKTRGHRISHVGIYVGGGRFMHASSGGHKVQENSLSDTYYRNRYAGARRVLRPSAPKEMPLPKEDPPLAEPLDPDPDADGG